MAITFNTFADVWDHNPAEGGTSYQNGVPVRQLKPRVCLGELQAAFLKTGLDGDLPGYFFHWWIDSSWSPNFSTATTPLTPATPWPNWFTLDGNQTPAPGPYIYRAIAAQPVFYGPIDPYQNWYWDVLLLQIPYDD